ncbi:MAG: NusG domain II-containing protein [Termitinemataceae bacterium]
MRIAIVATMKDATAAAAINSLKITRLSYADLVIFFLSLAITVVSFFLVYGSSSTDPQVIIEGSGKVWVYPLSTEISVSVPGPLGITIIEIHNGDVHVVASPCKNQLCVAAGSIRKPGQWVACLPNQVFVRIEGITAKDDLDGTTW